MLAARNVTGRKTQEREFLPTGCLYSSGLMCNTVAYAVRRKDDLGEDHTAECAKALGREHLAST